MTGRASLEPRVLALFQKRIEGDDALLELARLRFGEAGLGTEFYADTPGELEHLLTFKPSPDTPAAVHLSRDINVFCEAGRNRVIDFARAAGGRVFGLIVHDRPEIVTRREHCISGLQKICSGLRDAGGDAILFVEYAAGVDPDAYIGLIEGIGDIENISGCIDIGHIGIRQIRHFFSALHPEKDVCAFRPDGEEVPGLIDDIQRAVHSAADRVVEVIARLAGCGKPLHFHLHDGHPLSACSPFCVSDHLSFLSRIPLPFEYRGGSMLEPMFGPAGLSRIVTVAMDLLSSGMLSFSLEIHPVEGRLPLGDFGRLFDHWRDRTNAERMNYWLSVLLENHQLLTRAIERSMRLESGTV